MSLATSSAEQAAHVTKQAAKNVEEQLRSGSEAVYASARGEAERIVAERRDGVAGYAHDIADALGSAADTLIERRRDTAADFARFAADSVDALSSRVQGQDIGGTLHSIEEIARKRPILFLGGALVVGFALIRLFERPAGGLPTAGPGANI